MQDPTTPQPVSPSEPQDERAEWITPTITDYAIEEVTLSGTTGKGIDGPTSIYS